MSSEERPDFRGQHVLVITDIHGQRVVHLNAVAYTLGRDSSNSITIQSKSVSRQHATLVRTPSKDNQYVYQIMDGNLSGQRSKNGLKVNEETCQNHILHHGDQVTFSHDAHAIYFILDRDSEQPLDNNSLEFRSIKSEILDPTGTYILEEDLEKISKETLTTAFDVTESERASENRLKQFGPFVIGPVLAAILLTLLLL